MGRTVPAYEQLRARYGLPVRVNPIDTPAHDAFKACLLGGHGGKDGGIAFLQLNKGCFRGQWHSYS